MIEDDKASFSAVEFLIKKGRKKIGFIGGIKEKKVFQDRFKGYLDAMQAYDIPIHEELILHCSSLERQFEDNEIQHFFNTINTTPDAIFTCTDNYGLLTMKTLLKMGYKIPEDISVIGFGDLGLGNIFVPSLTCVSQPNFEMGEKAAELLIAQFNESNEFNHAKKVIKLKTNLVERDST